MQKQVSPRGKNVKPQNGSPDNAVHPAPISKDRLKFVIARLAILSDMIVELSTRPGRYHQNSFMVGMHATVISNIRAEQLQLLVEKNVLEEVIANVEQKVSE